MLRLATASAEFRSGVARRTRRWPQQGSRRSRLLPSSSPRGSRPTITAASSVAASFSDGPMWCFRGLADDATADCRDRRRYFSTAADADSADDPFAPTSTSTMPSVVRIGSVSRPLGPPPSDDTAHLLLRGYLPSLSSASSEVSQSTLAHLKWMLSKDNLQQDMLLVGPPGSGAAHRRRLALAYAELTRREAEVLTLSRDATEGDLKQRRELVVAGAEAGGTAGGGSADEGEGGAHHTKVVFVDQAPVRAALHGRILILDGLERAERNVLPALNNLLENREMHLEDGRLLVSARRYRELVEEGGGGGDEAAASSSFLVPVHEDFRVVALGVPCPPYEGASLDPPLRSRFQIRRVDNPTAEEIYSDLLASDGNDAIVSEEAATLCAKFAGAMEEAASAASSIDGGGGSSSKFLPLAFPSNSLRSSARILSAFPAEDPRSVLLRSYPAGMPSDGGDGGGGGGGGGRMGEVFSGSPRWESSRTAAAGAFDSLGVADADANDEEGAEGARGEGRPSCYEIQDVKRAAVGEDGCKFAEVTFSPTRRRHPPLSSSSILESLTSDSDSASSAETSGENVTVLVPCGTSPVHPAPSPTFVRTAGSISVLSAMVQEHYAGRDILLLSPRGEGKSRSASEFASILGYGPEQVELFGMYREMTGRDLLLRRATDGETGETRWEESPLIKAAREGSVCVLDGAEKLGGGDALATLQGLLVDREVALTDGRRLVRPECGDGGGAANGPMAVPVHPAFRVVALASLSGHSGGSSSSSFLNDDVQSMFGTVVVPPPTRDCHEAILSSSNPSCPPDVIDRVLNFHEMLTGDAAADCGVEPLSTRNLVRIARRCAASSASDTGEADTNLHDIICSVLVADLLPPTQRSALESLLKRAGVAKKKRRRKKAGDAPELSVSVEHDRLSIGEDFAMERALVARRPEMVPSPVFYDIPAHVRAMRDLLSEWKGGERAFLLLGNQGVGKNKIVDRICELARWEREYMQLHRDSTIGQLTLSPSLEDGRVVWKDSALVRAVSEGCALVVDEADKAPVEVVGVLKGLVEDGELLLADGRRISRNGTGEGIIPVHPNFTLWVLANRPGYPFHGNDFFREVGDCFSTKVIPNPDLDSEVDLLSSYAPSLDSKTLRRIAGSFADLRSMSEHGDISYPYSTREAVSVVRHLEMYPEDDTVSTLHNVLDMDSFDERLYSQIGEVFQRHGIPVTDYPSWREAMVRARAAASGDGRTGELSIEYLGDRTVEGKSSSPPSLSLPKHGRWDANNDPHVGGNQWAGGTGGSDTAGLGGRGGPYRLDRGHKVHQVSDEAKAEVSEEAAAAAREMAQKALKERLAEIGMSETEWKMYDEFVEPIRGDVANLRGTLNNVESRRTERGWIKRQSHGELDDSKLVDGVAGDRYVYKRRGVVEPQAGRPLQNPKRLRFVLDISGSMYRFNGYDHRLNRCLEAAALIMEAFDGMEERFEYSIVGHSGDSTCIPLVEFGNPPPSNAKERMKVLQSMVAHTQYCQSGDNTLQGMARAIEDIVDEGSGIEADEHIVIGVSDANLARYGIHPRQLGKIMERGAQQSRHPVKAYCIFIASFGPEAEDIKQSLPVGKGFVCMNTSELPRVVRNILSAQVR